MFILKIFYRWNSIVYHRFSKGDFTLRLTTDLALRSLIIMKDCIYSFSANILSSGVLLRFFECTVLGIISEFFGLSWNVLGLSKPKKWPYCSLFCSVLFFDLMKSFLVWTLRGFIWCRWRMSPLPGALGRWGMFRVNDPDMLSDLRDGLTRWKTAGSACTR